MSINSLDYITHTNTDPKLNQEKKDINKKLVFQYNKNFKNDSSIQGHKELCQNVKQNSILNKSKQLVLEKNKHRKKTEIKSRLTKTELQGRKPFSDINCNFNDNKSISIKNVRRLLFSEFGIDTRKTRDNTDLQSNSRNSINFSSNLNNNQKTDNVDKSPDNKHTPRKFRQKDLENLLCRNSIKNIHTIKDNNNSVSDKEVKTIKKEHNNAYLSFNEKSVKIFKFNQFTERTQEQDGIRIYHQKVDLPINVNSKPERNDTFEQKNTSTNNSNIFSQKDKNSYIRSFIKEIQTKNKEFLKDQECAERKNFFSKKRQTEISQSNMKLQDKSMNENIDNVRKNTGESNKKKKKKSCRKLDNYLHVKTQPPIDTKSPNNPRKNKEKLIVVENNLNFSDMMVPYYPLFKPRQAHEEKQKCVNQETYIYDQSRDKFKINNQNDIIAIAKKIAKGKLINLNKSLEQNYLSKKSIRKQIVPSNLDYNKNWFPGLKYKSDINAKSNEYSYLSDGSKVVKDDNMDENNNEFLYKIRQGPIISYKKIKEYESRLKKKPLSNNNALKKQIEPKIYTENKHFINTLNSWKYDEGSMNEEHDNFDFMSIKRRTKY